ncbi:hypothetical protein GALMADRAFT_239788 [Galerina marginata CBS 339.88]|uniref:Uncharacterized protein n=1 Tax=Galerina marginata (strain CBS 339.88) TaxID=685588 RepID=A0A067TP22_GALM3|nr:hypothetical protein GALMADRAFT_239788 [Galerina marginata CBS 339.88]
MVLPKQSYSFSTQSHGELLSSSQYDENYISNVENGIRRVTIRQLLNASPTKDPTLRFKINGIGIRKVMMLANVYFDNPTASGRSYGFDDGSGRINGYSRDGGTGLIIE